MFQFLKAFKTRVFVSVVLFVLIVGNTISAQAVLQPIDDAMVYLGNAANNYGSDVKLQVKKTPGSSITRNAYLKFDLAGITTSQVGKAILRLYCNNKAFDTVQTIIGVFSAGNNWVETNINWNNAPAFDANLSTTVILSKSNYYEWDVTNYIRQSLSAGTFASVGVADVQGTNNLIEFSSKEAANKPQLVITPQADTIHNVYYLDAVNGDDNNTGTSTAAPFKSLNKINSTNLPGGANVYLRSGQIFTGILNIGSNGTATNPIVYTTYGGTKPAIIDGQGRMSAVFAYNRSYIELKNLTVTNYRNGVIKGGDPFSGILFMNEDGGTMNHIYLDQVKVDNVNSSYNEDTSGTVYNGGVQFYSTGSRVPSNFNDVVIQNCTLTNLSRTGFNFRSDWDLRNVNTKFGDPLGDGRTDNWFASTNIRILNNFFKNITGNGLIVRVASKALIEGNLFDSCGTIISGNAAFNFNTDSTIYQYNEAKNTVYNNGDTDARGIDSDYRTKNTVIQYNYLHDNGLGGVVATGGDQTTGQIPQRFNVGTVIRYNLLENNNRQGISFSGAIDGLDVYNNTVYADASHNDVIIVRSAIWAVAPKNLRFKNNIFYYLGNNLSYSFASGSTYNFTNNLFYGNHPSSEPADVNKITADPKLNNAGKGEDGYKYLTGSAALNSGVLIADNGGRDYYGNPVSSTTVPNVGMYNGGVVTGSLPVTLLNFSASKSGNNADLNWSTSTEQNTLRFELESSKDGILFNKIGEVKAAGNSSSPVNYSFKDVRSLKGINYFRLKQVDVDGKFILSAIKKLNYDDVTIKLNIYPNPATTQIKVDLNSTNNGTVKITIYNIEGKKVQEEFALSSSDIKINISSLVRGIYSLEVNQSNTNEIIGKARFLKQ